MVFRSHLSLIRGLFGLGGSDQRLLSPGAVSSRWHLNWRFLLEYCEPFFSQQSKFVKIFRSEIRT